jgi:hypothetical protein
MSGFLTYMTILVIDNLLDHIGIVDINQVLAAP